MKAIAKKRKRGRSVCIYLDAPLYSYFDREAKVHKSTVPKVIKERLAIQPVSLFDQISDSLSDLGPGSKLGDLSTNPKYLKGFGKDVQPTQRRK